MDKTFTIIIVDGGWVLVGDVKVGEDGRLIITNCFTIRSWGTTHGIGQLFEGPTEHTILDPNPTVTLNPGKVIFSFGVDREAWMSSKAVATALAAVPGIHEA